jgi:uncharacterized membrane protein YkvA (DUF1232 family)
MWQRIVVLGSAVRGDARQLWRAWRHPAAPRWLGPALLLLVAYIVWPLDLIPDTVPVLGAVDDLVLVPLAMRWLLARLPATLREEIARGAT